MRKARQFRVTIINPQLYSHFQIDILNNNKDFTGLNLFFVCWNINLLIKYVDMNSYILLVLIQKHKMDFDSNIWRILSENF